jgi:hypothetical protein
MQGARDGRIGPGTGTTGRHLKSALIGLVLGYSIALVLGRSVWLEMRLNLGHAIPVSIVFFVLLSARRRRPMRLALFLIFEIVAAVVLFSTYGFNSTTLLIVPAALFRDGFHLNFLSLLQINLLLLCLLGTANAVWIYTMARESRRKLGSQYRPANESNAREAT